MTSLSLDSASYSGNYSGGSSGNASTSAPLDQRGVFVGLLDSWAGDRDLSYADCLGAIRILTTYDRALATPTLTLSQPIVITCNTCAIGIFVTHPPSAPHPAVNVIYTEDHNTLRYAISLVEIAVRGFRIGGFVDIVNGMQIAVWQKKWVDPSGVCGRITRVSLQDCLDKMSEYNGRMRKHASMFASMAAGSQAPSHSQLAAAVDDLQQGASAVMNQLLGPRPASLPSTVPFEWPNMGLTVNNPLFPITTAPAMLLGTDINSFINPTGASPNPLENLMALRTAGLDSIQTALAGFWKSITNESMPAELLSGLEQGPSEARRSQMLGVQHLGVQHLGGVVLPGIVEGAQPRHPLMSAPLVGDSYYSPNFSNGVVVGEGGWVNQQAFLTATGYLTAAATGRIVMVGEDTGRRR